MNISLPDWVAEAFNLSTHLLAAKQLSLHRAASLTHAVWTSFPETEDPPMDVPIGLDVLADLTLKALAFVSANCQIERDQIGFIVGTRFGCLETDIAFDRSRQEANGRYASPSLFARTLPSTVAAEAALRLGFTGPGIVLISETAPCRLAVERALAWLHPHSGLALQACIVGEADWHGQDQLARFCLLTRT